MNTRADTKMTVKVAKTENPMQERHCNEVTESIEEAAETIITEQTREIREGAGPVFVP